MLHLFQRNVKTSPVGQRDLVVENLSDQENHEKSGSELEISISSEEKEMQSGPLENKDAIE